ncbi:MAG: DUF2155 domain-containing protein [Parvularculaceae bacterium]
MKKAVLFFGLLATYTSASAQPAADPALDALNRTTTEAPSELDQLSRGDSSDFPDIEKQQQRKPVSVTLRALNKITAKYTDIVIKMNETATFGTLEITPRYCDKRPPEEFPETTAFLEIADMSPKREADVKQSAAAAPSDAGQATTTAAPEGNVGEERLSPPQTSSQSSQEDVARARALDDILSPDQRQRELPPGVIFSGWMFASSPALNPLDHPVYDVWVIDCKTETLDN